MSIAHATEREDLVLPRYCEIPAYFKTYGDQVAGLCSDANFEPDPQQRLMLDIIFARQRFSRDDLMRAYRDLGYGEEILRRLVPETGTWPRILAAAFEVFVIVGRQNLKSGTFKQACLGWLFLFDERLIVYSAHEFTTAMEMFRDMDQLVTGSDFLRKQVKRIIRNHGEEAIETMSGARLIFKTRTKGGGRGLSGRKVVLDEAYAVRPMHMGALLPTLSAQPDPQVLYGSAAGMAESETLREGRDRGRAGTDRVGYCEWAAPPPEEACDAGAKCKHAKTAVGCGCDKPHLWLQANPAIGLRIDVPYIAAERNALPVGEFTRERMGWWDEPVAGLTPITESVWLGCADVTSRIAEDSKLSIALDVAPDSSSYAVAGCGWRPDGLPHGELIRHELGTAGVVDALTGYADRNDPCIVMLDPAGPAGAYEKELKSLGFEIHPVDKTTPFMPKGHHRMHLVSARDNAQACGELTNAVLNGKFRHPGQKPLNEAVKAGRSRTVAQAWAWDSSGEFDICPLVAVTLAYLGLVMFGKKAAPAPFLLVGGR